MMNKRQTILKFILLACILVLLAGCGGSKETVNFEPDPFPEPDPVTEEPANLNLEPDPPKEDDIQSKQPLVLKTINFDFDRSSLTPTAKAMLAENARQLLENPAVSVRIEGHCDERGTVEYNLALGEMRAMVTRDYLINYGISPNQITVLSYGKERPLDPRHTPDAWDKNRRAEFLKITQ
ncbi:OmpA family protein [candidate division KSB1 bacterium]|nr:OmpA family protein [candidate division KSB1 bacterium]